MARLCGLRITRPAYPCARDSSPLNADHLTQGVEHLDQVGLRGHHRIHRIDVLVRGQDQSMEVVELPVCAMHARRPASRRRDGMGLAM